MLPPEYDVVPERTLLAVAAYVRTGQAVGHFLTAVLTNDLKEAFGFADDEHAACMQQIVRLVVNRIPSECQGSKAKVDAWHERGGALGLGWSQEDGAGPFSSWYLPLPQPVAG